MQRSIKGLYILSITLFSKISVIPCVVGISAQWFTKEVGILYNIFFVYPSRE